MQCALTQLPALNVLVRVDILAVELTVLVRSPLVCLHLMYLHEQVKGTLQFYDMSNSNGITVQVHKCYS